MSGVLAGAEEMRPAVPTEDAAWRGEGERPSEISGCHQREEAKPKHRYLGAVRGVRRGGERSPDAQSGATLKLTPKIAINCKHKGGNGQTGPEGKGHKGKKNRGAGSHGRSSKRSAAGLGPALAGRLDGAR